MAGRSRTRPSSASSARPEQLIALTYYNLWVLALVRAEDKIKNMGNAGKNGGEYYTPRPLIKTIVKVLNPKIGETVYDGAIGSAGFLRLRAEHGRKKTYRCF